MKSRLTAFHWDDCGGTAAHIISMSVIPDPIKLPGHMNISVHAMVDSALTSPLEVCTGCLCPLTVHGCHADSDHGTKTPQ